MDATFEPLTLPVDRHRLSSFLLSDEWPFHVFSNLSVEKVEEMIDQGSFDGSNNECFWILNEAQEEIGLVRLMDLDDVDDGSPLFDLRIRCAYRGKGIGKFTVAWLTKYLFSKYENLERIVGTTRSDNFAMRRIFRANGYAKEGHYRKDWPARDGKMYDTVKYGILRDDWLSGKTTPVQWNDEP